MQKYLVIFLVVFSILAVAVSGVFIYKHFTGSHASDGISHPKENLETSAQETPADPCQENLKTLQAAADKYKSDTGAYPPEIKLLVDKKYVQEIPKCPGGNGYSIDKDGKVFEDPNYNDFQNTVTVNTDAGKTAEKTFTKEELGKYNGKDGQPCYIALNGKVYDLTNMKGWKNGSHGHGILAGKDWTLVFEKFAPKSHKDPEFLKRFPVVGIYIGEKSTEIPKQLKGH